MNLFSRGDVFIHIINVLITTILPTQQYIIRNPAKCAAISARASTIVPAMSGHCLRGRRCDKADFLRATHGLLQFTMPIYNDFIKVKTIDNKVVNCIARIDVIP